MQPVGAARVRTALAALGGAAGAGLLVALVFLMRAGATGESNWPVHWELRSSDNGVLFQVMQDISAGRGLDWSFSPQVYVFPELPVSAAAFFAGGGDIYRYYLLVAAFNGALLFLALFLLVSVLFRSESRLSRVARATAAFAPLVILPLIGGAWLPAYHLAPTYYFGLYLMVFAAPAFFLVRGRTSHVLLGVALALTAASNPLVLVFCGAPFAAALALLWLRRGFGAVLRPAVEAIVVLAVALVVRLVFFSPLQGVSPLSYIDGTVFAGRLAALGPYFSGVAGDPATRVVLIIGAALALILLIAAAVLIVMVARRRIDPGPRVLTAVYLGLVPLIGLSCTLALLITHYLYFWPVLVAPFVIALLALPPRWAPRALMPIAAAFVVVAIASGGVAGLAHQNEYFAYRSAETRCLDEALPAGSVGYATFSDARRVSLPSATGIRLVPLKPDLTHATWLTNLDYFTTFPGSFFYLNSAGDEPELSRDAITGLFGQPDRIARCDGDHELFIYDDQIALAQIADRFGG